MTVRLLYRMQNEFTTAYQPNRQRQEEEGICTVTALQWCKKCLERGRGLGSYDELSLSDHQRAGLMAIWRHHDMNPENQTHAMGLRMEVRDRDVDSIQAMQEVVAQSGSKTAIFWNEYHTMGYRVGTGRAQEFEWFDNNFGCWVSNDEREMNRFMRDEWRNKYPGWEGSVQGVRVLQI